tara:strand:+ start:2003 stop:2698 length:696 start_codon:yes stop_codon:yes gene_type:complete
MVAEALPDVPFYVLDTDDTTERMLDDEYAGLSNVESILVENWDEFETESRDVLEQIDKEVEAGMVREKLPWIVVDMSDETWENVQDNFTQRVFGLDIDEYFVRAREAMGIDTNKDTIGGFSGWIDWTVIKRIYWKTWKPLTRGRKFNLFLVTGAKEVPNERDMKDLYSEIGRMPTGEKHMGHKMHTVLFSKVTSQGWEVSTAKDRGRDMLSHAGIENFVDDYLVKVAGWEI